MRGKHARRLTALYGVQTVYPYFVILLVYTEYPYGVQLIICVTRGAERYLCTPRTGLRWSVVVVRGAGLKVASYRTCQARS